ncbi:lipopolysaccharide biosynthesis protein [Sphingobium sp. MP9-4]|nr:lipopolysaccharide biosynthesis protein [Sphingobium sp. MP9-4]
MFMSGIMKPSGRDEIEKPSLRSIIIRGIKRKRYFIGLVVLPSLLTATYYYFVASDQYESTADYVVRRADAPQKSSGGAAALLGFGAPTGASADPYIVSDYLLSHDAVKSLRRDDNLVGRFRRTSIDFISALKSDDPSPEKLLKYYRDQVGVEQNLESGISQIKVRAFTPQDSYHIADKLLKMGEDRVNQINERTTRGQLSSAQNNLANAEKELANIQRKITLFRQKGGDINPTGSGKAQIELVSQLTASLASARARLNSLQGFISPSSPQYRAVAAQVSALQRQVDLQNARLAGAGNNIAVGLGTYEDLIVRQDFAAKRYAAAAAVLDEAKAQALRQQIYLVRVVDPNMPVKSLYPERGRIVITVFFSLLIAYAVGWLMLAGVREHKM